SRGILRHHGKHHLTRAHVFQAKGPWNQFTVWRKDGRNAHQVLRGNTSIPKRQLKRGESFLVLPHALGEEDALGNHVFSQFLSPPDGEVATVQKKNTTRCGCGLQKSGKNFTRYSVPGPRL